VVDGTPDGTAVPRSFAPLRNTTPASAEAGALGRFAVAVPELAVALPRFAVTIGCVVLLPPSATKSTIVIRPPGSVFAKRTVMLELVPLSVLGVVT
jgi:hypothetical protein